MRTSFVAIEKVVTAFVLLFCASCIGAEPPDVEDQAVAQKFTCDLCTSSDSCSTWCADAGGFTSTCGEAGETCGGTGSKGDTEPSSTTPTYYYKGAYPVVLESAITDIREGSEGFASNGPDGYAFFGYQNEDYCKNGNIFSSVGGMAFDSCVHASNFQGPVNVPRSWKCFAGYCYYDPPRNQWEWTVDGGPYPGYLLTSSERQISSRRYPLVWASRWALSLSKVSSQVWEDDDGFQNDDDYLGTVTIDNTRCDSDVFAKGLSRGWTNVYFAQLPNDYSIIYVKYQIWCVYGPSTMTLSQRGVGSQTSSCGGASSAACFAGTF